MHLKLVHYVVELENQDGHSCMIIVLLVVELAGHML